MKSLRDLMAEGTAVSLSVAYKSKLEDGSFYETRDEGDLSPAESDLVFGWADGLVQADLQRVMEGRVSLRRSIEFDVAEAEKEYRRQVAAMKRMLRRLGPPVVVNRETGLPV